LVICNRQVIKQICSIEPKFKLTGQSINVIDKNVIVQSKK